MTQTVTQTFRESAGAPSVESTDHPAILMVDDQPARLLTYDVILADLPVVRVHARSARDALSRLLEREFAVILLDVHMPEMDGFELARAIREHPRLERTPIIFVTGAHVNAIDQLKGYEVGAVDYMSVPVVPEILRSKVAVLIELHQRSSELRALNQALAEARTALAADRARAIGERECYRRAVVDHPSDHVVVFEAERDGSGAIVDWVYRNANRNALKLLGMPLDTLIGKRIGDVLPARADDFKALCHRAFITGEPARYEGRHGNTDFLVSLFSIGEDLVVASGTDITERKRVENKSRQDAERFELIAETLPHIVWTARADGSSDYYNQRFLSYLGCTRDAMQGDTWLKMLHPDDSQGAVAAWKHSVATGKDYAAEFRIRRASDGEYRWHEAHAVALRDEEGSVIRWFGTCTDIHERRQATDALHASERRHRALLEKAPVGVAHNTLDGRFAYVNDAFCRIVGYTADELYSKTWQEITHPDDVNDDTSLGQQVLAGELTHYNIEKRYVGKNGSHVWVSMFGNFVLDEQGQPILGVAVAVDITERKLAERALRESEERFRELAHNIDQLVWTCDELGQATWYNDRWFAYTGTTFAQMRGDGWKIVHDPAQLDRVMASLKHSLSTGEVWEDTFPLRAKDGTYRWFLSRAVPIRDESGRVIRWMGTNTDITEQRRLQDELKETDRRKDEFLAMLAHELRNPIAPITSAAAILARIGPKEEQQRKLINVVQRQTKQLTVLLDDLLDSARVTQGRVDLRREVVSVQACLDLAIEAVQPMLRDKQHRLSVTHTIAPLFVNVDKARLTQCLTNVLTNAVKFTNPSGDIGIKVELSDGQVVIVVKDTGIGIKPEFLPRIFDVFAQGERTLDRSQGGLGIGLSVCKRLMELHGGTITAHSDGLTHGASFEFRLPQVEAPRAAVESPERTTASSHRILIVDDNQDAADTLAMLLQLNGHHTHTVYSAKEAIEVAGSYAPHTIFLDIGLPEMDGYEVARRIRSIMSNEVRLIALSGYGQGKDKQRSKAAGFEAHFVKPLDPEILDELLSR